MHKLSTIEKELSTIKKLQKKEIEKRNNAKFWASRIFCISPDSERSW